MGMKITIGQLRSIIRETLEDLQRPASLGHGRSPDWETILRKFEELRDENGEVPEDTLAREIGVSPSDLDYNGTGLRVVDGVVSEMLYDTPYR
jgi:hypothetical protein